MSDGGYQLADGYRIEAFADQDAVSGADIVELWIRERALPEAEAQRRVGEITLVATDPARRPAGVSTAYLRYNAQLRAELWYIRAFVAAAHRNSSVAVMLAVRGREHLVERYLRGGDRRGIGLIYEIENEGLKRYFPQAHWLPTDFLFIGENERGDHVRVHYFPGALAPEPAERAP
jgi:hypothetical protein